MKTKLLLLVIISFLFRTLGAQSLPKAQIFKMNLDSNAVMDATWKNLAEQAKKVRVFMAGENHNEVDFNALMEFGLMNRLHAYAGYRHYVIELSPARAHYLNRYILYSDTHARDALKGVSSLKYMNLFENLHKWNQRLEPEERIMVHGVDVERFFDLSFERLAEPLRNSIERNTCPDSILVDVLAIVSYANRRFEDRLNHYKKKLRSEGIETDDEETGPMHLFYRFDYAEYIQRIEKQIHLYRDWLNENDFKEFSLALEGVKECQKWGDDSESASRFHWRETVMFQRYVRALNENPKGRFFGQFGRCHISETPSDVDCGWYAYESVVNRLIEYYFKSKDSVITMGYFYPEKSPSVTAQNIDKMDKLNNEIQNLLRAYHSGMVLYDLEGSDSDLRELRKKYRYILVNNAKNKALTSELPTEDIGSDISKSSYQWELSLPYFGFGYWNLDNQGMIDHFTANGVSYENQPQLSIQHQLNVNYGPVFLGISGYYSLFNDRETDFANYTDSTGSVYSRMWGVDVMAGLHYQRGPWVIELGGRLGTARLQYQYKELLNSAISVRPVNGMQIHNQSWNVGLNLNMFYRMSREAGFGIQANSYSNIGNGSWVYSGSNQLYQNLPLNSGLEAWSITAQICLFFSP